MFHLKYIKKKVSIIIFFILWQYPNGEVFYSLYIMHFDHNTVQARGLESGQSWCEMKWPGAGSLGTRRRTYAALRCPRNKIGSPLCCESALSPGEQTVSALAVGACLDGGGVGQTTGNGNGKESDGAGARCFAISLVMKWHTSRALCCSTAGVSALRNGARDVLFLFCFGPLAGVFFFDRRLGRICLLFLPWAALVPSPQSSRSSKTVSLSGSLFIIRTLFVPCQLIFQEFAVNTTRHSTNYKQTSKVMSDCLAGHLHPVSWMQRSRSIWEGFVCTVCNLPTLRW